jgi:hypothetical protein
MYLEELEVRTVPSAPPVPTGLAVVIANDDSTTGAEVGTLDLTPITDPQYSYISGVAFQIDWRDIEPLPPVSSHGEGPGGPIVGPPDWSRLDAVIGAADTAGKWVQLLITPGFFSPACVLSPFSQVKSDQFHIQYGQDSGTKTAPTPPMTLPIPWNQGYLNEWFAFLKQVSHRYESDPSFRMIAAAGPTSVSDEMTEPEK